MKTILIALVSSFSAGLLALGVGDTAPIFTLKDQDSQSFTLAPNKNKTWMVLFFYPKANTPGCTKQACAFRDSIKVIENENAVVYGISTSSVADIKKFQDKHQLNFKLLSDKDGKASKAYGAKYPVVNIARRYTFILDSNLIIRHIEKDVDPVSDAKRVAKKIQELAKRP
ncbi:MAG: peroxiredoxin [Myxococcaceae bacterium]